MKKMQQILSDDATNSLIGVNASTAVKGFLLLLVILGHNRYLMAGEEMFAFKFLYSFHVYAFFLLVGLYDYRAQSSFRFLVKNLRRFYIPYIFIFLLMYIISEIKGSDIEINHVLGAYLSGDVFRAWGFGSAFWFIPTMFVFLILKQLYYASSLIGRSIFILAGMLGLIVHSYLFPQWIIAYVPLCVWRGLGMLFLAIVFRWIYQRYNGIVWINLLFYFVVVAAFIIYSNDNVYLYLTFNRIICPLAIFLFILQQLPAMIKSQWLIKLGQNSFPIYVIHIFLYQIVYILFDKLNLSGLTIGVVAFVMVTMVSYFISKLKVMKFVFPH